jgi:hypothetical protein
LDNRCGESLMPGVPFSVPHWLSLEVTPELRRAAEYHEGRKLTDHEVGDVLQREIVALLAHWTAVGRWMNHLDMWGENARPKLSGITVNNPPQEERDRRSASMRRVWAEKRAKGQRLPASTRAPARAFGQRAVWRTPAQKAHQSAMMRQAWARRKALQKEA